jgi:DNA-binding NtrC family response regulator
MCQMKPSLRVAVIDDERVIADSLAEILRLHGYEVKAHYSGESAMADALEFSPQVVLSDIQMNTIDGVETAVRIRETQPQCRIILVSASPMSGSIYERICGLGFEFLQKPVRPQEILAALREDPSMCRKA